jgi:PAS domain S-box-containing protein
MSVLQEKLKADAANLL